MFEYCLSTLDFYEVDKLKKKVFRTGLILCIEGRLFTLISLLIPPYFLYGSLRFLLIPDFNITNLFLTVFSISTLIAGIWVTEYFWQLCWGKLIITSDRIIWRCLFCKKQVILLKEIKHLKKVYFDEGNAVANRKAYKNSFGYILISKNKNLPNLRIDKIRSGNGLIKFPMSDKVWSCIRTAIMEKRVE